MCTNTWMLVPFLLFPNNKKSKTYTSYTFWTLSSLMITEMYGLFYIAGVKVVVL